MGLPFIINATEANFDYEVIEFSQRAPVVVDFWAEWCVPCKMLDPILRKLAEERDGEFRLARVNVDENQKLALRFNVRGIPAVKAFREGKIVAEFTGLQPEPKIRKFLDDLIPTHLDLNLEKAHYLLDAQDWRLAHETFQEVLLERPGHPNALLGMAKTLLAMGRGIEARDILNAFPVSHEFASAERLKPLANALARIELGLLDTNDPIEATYNHSLRLVKLGNLEAAMDGILEVLRRDKGFRAGEPREVMLSLLEILGPENPVARQYQKELASILF